MNGIDQRGYQIIRCPRIFRGLTGCQSDPRVGTSQKKLLNYYYENNVNACFEKKFERKTGAFKHG